jgi:acyl-CoA thioester hydrolase
MDLLGHVNNVTYLDYVTEAREALFAGHPVARAPVVRYHVEFRKPLVFRRRPVLVDTWVTDTTDGGVTLASEVYDVSESSPDDPSQRTTYLRATSVLSHALSEEEHRIAEATTGPTQEWRPLADDARPAGDDYCLTVRRSDLGEDGNARAGVFLEYAQEARIRYLMSLHTRGESWSHHVVARTDVDYLAPMPYRQQPYSVNSWVSHLGSRSFTIRSEVRDGGRVLAQVAVVMVAFDVETQGTAEMTGQQRARLEREIRDGV